jgi:hypothetical protein
VRKALEDEGFDLVGTGSYEREGASFADLADALTSALAILKAMPGGGKVDHVWTYVDRST